jgi:glutathione S-transferase
MKGLVEIWADQDIPIILRSTATSPYGRKVRMAAEVLGFASRIERRDADTMDPDDSLRLQNPLGKMPCLLIGDSAFYDSRVILELLDAAAGGGRLIPSGGIERYRCLTMASLADGVTDAALLIVYETRFRKPGSESERWLSHQSCKIERALGVLSVAPPDPTRADVASIALAAALGYLDWRQPVEWRVSHPELVQWLEQFASAHEAFAITERTME